MGFEPTTTEFHLDTWGNHVSVAEWTWRIIWSNYRKLAWAVRSDALTDWAITIHIYFKIKLSLREQAKTTFFSLSRLASIDHVFTISAIYLCICLFEVCNKGSRITLMDAVVLYKSDFKVCNNDVVLSSLLLILNLYYLFTSLEVPAWSSETENDNKWKLKKIRYRFVLIGNSIKKYIKKKQCPN